MHNASSVHVSNLFIDGKTGPDGLDLVNSRDILIESSRIEGSDDGLCFVSMHQIIQILHSAARHPTSVRCRLMPSVRCWDQKSQADAGLGAFPATNVTVRQSYLSSECCNAIMFGSRTEVDMSDFTFEDLVLGSVRASPHRPLT